MIGSEQVLVSGRLRSVNLPVNSGKRTMTMPRITIARWMVITLLVGLGLALLKYAFRKTPNPAIVSKRFAFIGRIDINRDSKDDRAELRRLIEEAGGVVDFDLPPPSVGAEAGTLAPGIDWYVTDDRPVLRRETPRDRSWRQSSPSQVDQRMRGRLKEARLSGIRPMPIGRLLVLLGHDER
jgi:hypothetical protein